MPKRKGITRKYETTHPWLTFVARLDAAGYDFWMQLGAAKSKINHVAMTLLPPEISRELHELYLAKGIHATTAIEGNTLSEGEVRKIMLGDSDVRESQKYQAQEIQNVLRACNSVADRILKGAPADLSVEFLKECNREILRDLPLPDGIVPGEIPTHNVVVAGYRGAPREDCEFLLERLCRWINAEIPAPSAEQTIPFAIIRAMLGHLYLAWIHPFGDGNGRTARLVELQVLLSAGIPSVCAHLLSNHYNHTRHEYYRQLSVASKSGGNIVPFLSYAINGMVDGLSDQIRIIDGFQWKAMWKSVVYKAFHGKETKAAVRQRQVALDLYGRGSDGVPRSQVRRLTPDVTVCYGKLKPRTVNRDVDVLIDMELVEEHGANIRAKFHPMIEAHLPKRRQGSFKKLPGDQPDPPQPASAGIPA